MTIKLVQKRFLKGSKEFVIIDEMITATNKSLFKEEKLTVDLSNLDPEPVINGSELAFYNPHKGRPVFSLWLNKPNKEEFESFVGRLKQSISGEDDSSADIETVSAETAQEALARNMHEEPPAFVESDDARTRNSFEPVNVERLADDLNMLKTYLDDDRYNTLFDALEGLKAEPENETAFQKVLDTYNDLGIYQGAVLTYAPYLIVLVSKYSP